MSRTAAAVKRAMAFEQRERDKLEAKKRGEFDARMTESARRGGTAAGESPACGWVW